MSQLGDRAVSRASFLSPPDFHRLDWACRPVYIAFGTPPYLVGSVLHREDYRDIDLRLILVDETFSAMVPDEEIGLLLNIALSTLIGEHAGLSRPIDFQIVQMTAANEEFGRQARNPMGIRHDQRERRREEEADRRSIGQITQDEADTIDAAERAAEVGG